MSGLMRRIVLALAFPALLACGGGGGGGGEEKPPKEKGFRVLETTPGDHSFAVARNASIQATFSEEVRAETIDDETFKVTEDFTGKVVRGTLTVSADRRSVQLVPTGLLALDTQYRLLATTDIENRFGERMRKDFAARFHTVVTDTGPPPPPPPPPAGRLELVGSMFEGRSSHTATRLSTGAVLVTGGFRSSTEITDTAETYDPNTRVFTRVLEALRVARANHTASLLPDGKVLIVGGLTEHGASVTASTEIYAPSTQTFSVGPSMSQARCYHTATTLEDGRILIAGGAEMNASARLVSTRTAEIYDPGTGKWAILPNMEVYRSDHQATLLVDGRVLITGGSFSSTTAEIFDPAKNSFSATNGPMKVARAGHTATILIGGSVVVTGGGSRSGEIYTPGVSRFDSTPGVPLVDRTSHTAELLASGRVLMVGGYEWATAGLTFHQTIEFFNGPPGQSTFVMSQELLTYARTMHRTTVLKNGDVLITGGANLDPMGMEIAPAEIYTFR